MKLRKITSLTAGLAFLVMTLTSIILYIVPQGRIAYWADWRLWGLTKTQWGDIHINTGFLFLIALILHIYYNWKPIVNYLKNQAKKLKIFTPDFNVAAVIIIVCILGTYFSLPPFSTVLDIGAQIKDDAAQKYGEPPYGHAELSTLKSFTSKLKLDLEQSMDLLARAGIKVENPEQTLSEIGRINRISPNTVFMTIESARIIEGGAPASAAAESSLPDMPPTGTGNLTLESFCSTHGLDLEQVVSRLKGQGLSVTKEMTLKKIAQENNISPIDIYDKLKEYGRPNQ